VVLLLPDVMPPIFVVGAVLPMGGVVPGVVLGVVPEVVPGVVLVVVFGVVPGVVLDAGDVVGGMVAGVLGGQIALLVDAEADEPGMVALGLFPDGLEVLTPGEVVLLAADGGVAGTGHTVVGIRVADGLVL
jgi:hypothetical protein